jgi:hypothetical protein
MTTRRNLLKSMLAAPLALLGIKAKAKPETVTFSSLGEPHGLKSGPGIVVTGPNTIAIETPVLKTGMSVWMRHDGGWTTIETEPDGTVVTRVTPPRTPTLAELRAQGWEFGCDHWNQT